MDEEIEQFFDEKLTKDQLKNLLRNIESDDNLKDDYISRQNAEAIFSLIPLDEDFKKGRENFGKFMQEQNRRYYRKRLYSIMKYAAIVCISLLSVSIYSKVKQSDTVNYTIKVPAGQRTEVQMGDGTLITLNSNAELYYNSDFGIKNRDLTLIGEAFLKVTKNEKLPLMVSAGETDIRVLGTTFSVNYKNWRI